MYYLLNETKQIIAADDDFLNLCNVNHIHDLCTKTMQGDIHLDIDSETRLTLSYAEEKSIYQVTATPFSSLLGTMTLITLLKKEEELIFETKPSLVETNPTEDETDFLNIAPYEEKDEEKIETQLDETLSDSQSNIEELDTAENFLIDIDDIPTEKNTNTLESNQAASDTDDSALFNLVSEDHVEEEKENDTSEEESESALETDETALFDLLPNNQLTEEKPEEEILKEDVNTPIYIDLNDISQKIGISPEDYNTFLNEFIDTSLDLEKDLQSQNIDKKENAINTLSHLSEILYLPMVNEKLLSIKKSEDYTLKETVESYYTTLSRITTEIPNSDTSKNDIIQEKDTDESLQILEISDEIEKPLTQSDEAPETQNENSESFGEISLEGIEPKYFDFQLEEAANDLSLPVELIEEFVHDFIEQAHIETQKMLESYNKGDLESIQNIGHLLKGASSNLRINDLSDTLYKIQFCEDPSQLEHLIKDYWAHFLSFEHQIKMLSN